MYVVASLAKAAMVSADGSCEIAVGAASKYLVDLVGLRPSHRAMRACSCQNCPWACCIHIQGSTQQRTVSAADGCGGEGSPLGCSSLVSISMSPLCPFGTPCMSSAGCACLVEFWCVHLPLEVAFPPR
eukprot:5487296-Amphidinium_carterae.1